MWWFWSRSSNSFLLLDEQLWTFTTAGCLCFRVSDRETEGWISVLSPVEMSLSVNIKAVFCVCVSWDVMLLYLISEVFCCRILSYLNKTYKYFVNLLQQNGNKIVKEIKFLHELLLEAWLCSWSSLLGFLPHSWLLLNAAVLSCHVSFSLNAGFHLLKCASGFCHTLPSSSLFLFKAHYLMYHEKTEDVQHGHMKVSV